MDKSRVSKNLDKTREVADQKWELLLLFLNKNLAHGSDSRESQLIREVLRQDGLAVRHALTMMEFGLAASMFLGAPAALASQLLPYIDLPQTSPTFAALTAAAKALEATVPLPIAIAIRLAVAAFIGLTINAGVQSMRKVFEELPPKNIITAVRHPREAYIHHLESHDIRQAYATWKAAEKKLIAAEMRAYRAGVISPSRSPEEMRKALRDTRNCATWDPSTAPNPTLAALSGEIEISSTFGL